MAKKRFKPGLRTICAIGTVAHNRDFTPGELAEYARVSAARGKLSATRPTIAWLLKHGHVRKTKRGRYYPTGKGWKMIEKACSR
jgi:hypothetical protein